MTVNEIKEQMQEDVMSLLESFGIKETMNNRDWDTLNTLVCDMIINYINELKKEA